jgi:pyruvate/2-oxoglutarate dehydrogenase complex dihydrolipoamide dehydrogenase (E3) component
MYTDPPLAHVGLSEREARRRGIAVRVARLPISDIARARTTDELRGTMKVLVSVDDRILGFTMIGVDAGEVVAVVQIAMLADLPYRHVRDAIIARPTMAEGLVRCFRACWHTDAGPPGEWQLRVRCSRCHPRSECPVAGRGSRNQTDRNP